MSATARSPRARRPAVIVGALIVIGAILADSGSALAETAVTLSLATQTTLVQPMNGVGYKFFDTATLTGVPSYLPAPTGTVTFNAYGPITYPFVYGPASCTGVPQYTSTDPVEAGATATSSTFVSPDGGKKLYLFTAGYSGDTVYAPIVSECGAPGEEVEVPLVALAYGETRRAPTTGGPSHEADGTTPPSRMPFHPFAISRLTFSPNAFVVEGPRRTHGPAKVLHSRHQIRGTTVEFALSGSGAVMITISKVMHGLSIAGRGCVSANSAPQRALRTKWTRQVPVLSRREHCIIKHKVGKLVYQGHRGINHFHFMGRLGSRMLAAGPYVARGTINLVSATGAVSSSFRVIPFEPQ